MNFSVATRQRREQIRHVQSDVTVRNTCKSDLETQIQLRQGVRLNTSRLTCVACRCSHLRIVTPLSNRWGDFHPSHSGKTGASCLLNPLAGSVAPVGRRHIPEICDNYNLTESGHGLSASGGEQVAPGTFTTSAGDIIPVAHVRTRRKALRTLQTSAKGVELARKKHRGQTPAYEVGRVGLRKRVHKPVFGNVFGVGMGSAVAPTLRTAVRTDSIRQKAAPHTIKVNGSPCGLLWMRQAHYLKPSPVNKT